MTRSEELPELPFRRYRACSHPVIAVRLLEREGVPNSFARGGFYWGEAGAWKVFFTAEPDPEATAAIVDPAVFEETYEPIEGDRYRKRSTALVQAAQLAAPLDIVTLEGPAHGEPGDWLIIGRHGEPYFNSNTFFLENYQPFDEVT